MFKDPAVADFIRGEIVHRNNPDIATIYCFTVMPDHLHLLISLGPGFGGTLQSWVSAFKSFTAKSVKREFGIWKLWQVNFYEHIVRHDESLIEITNYIINNPVRKNLAKKWDEYPYSGLLADLQL